MEGCSLADARRQGVGPTRAAKRAIDFEGPSAILFESPCVQLVKPKESVSVNTDTCTGCKKCITEIGCPGLGFDQTRKGAKSKDRGQAFVDASLCNGCGLCVQVCPFKAIELPGNAEERRPMRNVLLTGVGGQGTVLAAKVLAQAAQAKGWQVRTAETIGMAQRGGSVVSHVRMGDNGEEVIAPLVAKGTADMIIAFEPAEAARVLPYLAPDGVMVSATTSIQPITAALSTEPYLAEATIASLDERLNKCAAAPARFVLVDDESVLSQVGNRKALNTVLLAFALKTGHLPLSLDDLRDAIRACVKPRFVELNLAAIDLVESKE